jgi:hypothetical protein
VSFICLEIKTSFGFLLFPGLQHSKQELFTQKAINSKSKFETGLRVLIKQSRYRPEVAQRVPGI